MVAVRRVSGVRWLLGVALLPVLFSACGGESKKQSDPAGGAGNPGSAGSPASAGTSACHAERAPTPSASQPVVFDPDVVARAAAVIGACVPDDGVARNAGYLWSGQASSDRIYERMQMQLECLANSACGCAATDNCLGYVGAPIATCAPGCKGDVFTACGAAFDLQEGYGLSVDCKSLGLRCDSTQYCIDGAPIVCDEHFVRDCNSSGQPEYCEGSLVLHGPTCADLGLDCVAGACTGRGAACTSTSSSIDVDPVVVHGTACDGTTLTACVNGKETRVECRERGPGFGCQHVADAYFCGLAGECEPPDGSLSATPTSCNGTVLEFCSAGRLEHIDCVTLGFTGCAIDTAHGAFGCTPGISLP